MAEGEEVVFTTSTGPVRVITAASLFDGHDAAINVMRRLINPLGLKSFTSAMTNQQRRSLTAPFRKTPTPWP